MIAVILAGGMGIRLSEETNLRPKPMVEIGGKPILWYIMKIYAAHGIDGKRTEDWKVHLVETGLHTQTGVDLSVSRSGSETMKPSSSPMETVFQIPTFRPPSSFTGLTENWPR